MNGMSGMGGMDGMPGTQPQEHPCKISMLWNWDTIDTCFLSKEWHVHSHGGFAGLCIGVILIVILLEFFRHASRQYDAYLTAQAHEEAALFTQEASPLDALGSLSAKDQKVTQAAAVPVVSFRPNLVQQAIRALLHTLQFATAYWVMLLAMYYNGYIIICILIGAFIGSFIFQWERLSLRSGGAVASGNAQEVTGCCG
ncbi:Ctr copper transporter family-domain-containing protein [Xylaria venustula]|nr:Ctr copper transporter family-domain-containing protein [Xylaria venustula]